MNQLLELKSKGHIQGNEEAQVFPTGDWSPITGFDFYKDLMDENKTIVSPQKSSHEETFVIDLTKIRNQKNEKEIEKIDITHHNTVQELTETVYIGPKSTTKVEKTPEPKVEAKIELELDDHDSDKALGLLELDETEIEEKQDISDDKTALNPVAQQDIERLKRQKKQLEEQLKAEAEAEAIKEAERKKAAEAKRLMDADESTQMIRLDKVKGSLIEDAEEEERRIEKEAKAIKKKKREEEAEAEDDSEDVAAEAKKKKNIRLIVILAILALGYAFLFPSEDKPQKPPFVHQEPVMEFPIPFDKADSKRSKIEFDKAAALFAAGDYLSLIKAGILLKSSYENNIESQEALNLLTRDYAEQLRYSRLDKQANAQIVFNLIQSKRPYLAKDPNGVIGLNLFYMTINKPEAAADVVSKYLKLYPQNVTQDLFAVYLRTLMKIGKIDLARQFLTPLEKAPQKNRYTYDALIEFSNLNGESEKALEYVDDAIKNFPKLVGFYLLKADMMIKLKKYPEAEAMLAKADELNLENNEINRAKFLELKGLLIAYKGDPKTATDYFKKSLSIEDSMDLRMRLAELSASDDPKDETAKLIFESKALKLLNQSKDFFSKRSYQLALSYAAKAADVYPGYIPTELNLAKMQLKMGLAKQALKTLEALYKKYPDDRSINLALVDAYIDTYKFNDAKNLIGRMSATDLKGTYEFASVNGRLYIRMGDPLQAISWLRNSININPLNDTDIYLLAELLIKRANFDPAKSLLNKCMELDPINPDYRIAYSKIIYEQQDDQAAIGYLLGLMNEFGENPKVLSEIAIMYYRAGKVKDFMAFKEKLEKMPVKDKSLYEFLIRAALLDERYVEIPGLVEQLIAIEPGETEAMMTAGRVLFESGKLVEAAMWFKRIQERLDTYPKVRYYSAKIKYLSRSFDEALAEVEEDLKSNGDNDADLTLMAQIWTEKGDLVQAENLYKRSQKINPKNYESLMGLADISTKRNNFDLALDLYKKAMTLKGDEALIHKKIGDVYRLLGQGALAVESYKLYLEMNPEAADKNQIQSYINLMQ